MRWFVIKNPFLFLKCLIYNHSKISQVKTQVHCRKKLKFNSEIVKILQRHLDICLGFNQKRRLIWATLHSPQSIYKRRNCKIYVPLYIIYSHRKIISSNHLYSFSSNFMYVFSKCVTLTKLSLKNWEMNNSHNTAHLRKNDKLSLTEKIFREINSLVTSLVKPLVSRNFCQKVRERISRFSTLCLYHPVRNFISTQVLWCFPRNLPWIWHSTLAECFNLTKYICFVTNFSIVSDFGTLQFL